jgi:hypothetical protein
VTVDGTDFRVGEPNRSIQGRWNSHKINRAGLRYEIAICIQTGEIVWINGPFPCGEYPDVKIFRLRLKTLLAEGEKVESNGGYGYFGHPDDRCCVPKVRTEVPGRARAQALARHEAVNARFKAFNILQNPFRNDVARHGTVFRAVAVLVQIQMDCGQLWAPHLPSQLPGCWDLLVL